MQVLAAGEERVDLGPGQRLVGAGDLFDDLIRCAALTGARAAYVTFQPDLAVPGSTAIITAFGAAARALGLERLVLLSGRGEPEAQACEQALLRSGIDTTVVRCSFFAQNFSEHFLRDAVVQGVLARLRDKLIRNQEAVALHLRAVEEVGETLQASLQAAESDGTYSARVSAQSGRD